MAPRWSWDFEDEKKKPAPGPQPAVVAPPGAQAARPPQRAMQIRRRRLGAGAIVVVLLVVAIASASGSSHGPKASSAGKAQPHVARNSAPTDPEQDGLAAVRSTLAFTPFVREGGSRGRDIALTFDDGPGPYTPQILSVLERHHVPATFFEVGVLERYFHASTAAIVARGYPIGDHTQTHAPMSRLSPKGQQSELLQDAASIGDFGAPFPRLFRPPYGLWNSATLALLKKYRMLMVLWTVDTSDYQEPGTDVIVDRAVAGAKPGAIILMHDAGGNRSETVAALPQIIRRLRARGYKLVTVPRLLLDNPAPADQNVFSLVGAGG
jgi:peptidoglycan-N-acetylglucosamine deacetylase